MRLALVVKEGGPVPVNLVHDSLQRRLGHHVNDINKGIGFGRSDPFGRPLRQYVEFLGFILVQCVNRKATNRPGRARGTVVLGVVIASRGEFSKPGVFP
jgi:hypothetical protein